ncbi:MAG: DHA2 family efflux MFS transporter permease subunit [Sporolactobacillus sp.]|nr:DHA2 family efflux MFS transporter permease subunit [Sporolactobacillus sp.]
MKDKRVIGGFIGLAIAMFMGTLDATIINIALPDITDYFHASINNASWISTIYVLVLSVTMITAAKLADQFGRKKVMLIGVVLFGCSSALCGYSHTLMFLIAMRAVQGLGGAVLMPIAIPMSIDLLGQEKMEFASSTMGATTALAAASGPPLGGFLLNLSTWQSIFFVNVPFAILAFILIAAFVGESYDETISKQIDFPGLMLLSAALFLLTFALLEGNDYGWRSTVIITMLLGSAGGFLLFLLTELKVKAPMIELHLFRERTFTASVLSYLIAGFGIIASSMILSYFLQDVIGDTPLQAAYIIMTISLAVVVAMPLGSKIMTRTGARPIIFSGMLLMAAGLLLLAQLRVDTDKPIMIIDLIIYGLGFGLDTLSIISAIKHLPLKKNGIASGIVNAARNIGTCLAIALLIGILDHSIDYEKSLIRSDAADRIHRAALSPTVKAVAIRDIDRLLKTDDSQKQKVQTRQMTHDLKTALKKENNVPTPKNGTIRQFYHGAGQLTQGAAKTAAGQKQLTSGIEHAGDGLHRLVSGGQRLMTGSQQLNNGLEHTASGTRQLNQAVRQSVPALISGTSELDQSAQKLAAATDNSIPTLITGTQQLSKGTQQLLKQFSPGTDRQKTIFDGITATAEVAGGLPIEFTRYQSMIDSLLFTIIHDNPNAADILTRHQQALDETKRDYSRFTGRRQTALAQKITTLQNTVQLYQAAVHASSFQQFRARLSGSATAASSQRLEARANQLAALSSSVAGQVAHTGTFYNRMRQLTSASRQLAENSVGLRQLATGANQLATGTSQLGRQSKKLTALQSGTDQLAHAAGQLSLGSRQLFTGAGSLTSGLQAASSANHHIAQSSIALSGAGRQLHNGSRQLKSGIATYSQALEAEKVMKSIRLLTNRKLADAFDRNFLIAGLILIVVSPIGLLTDRKERES